MPRQSTTFVLQILSNSISISSVCCCCWWSEVKKFVLSRCYQKVGNCAAQIYGSSREVVFGRKLISSKNLYDQQSTIFTVKLTRCPLGHAPSQLKFINWLIEREDPIVRGNPIKRIKWEKFMWWLAANGLQRIRSRAVKKNERERKRTKILFFACCLLQQTSTSDERRSDNPTMMM